MGWVFKSGDKGLGYYRDSGGLEVTMNLAEALFPTSSLPPATLQLDSLLPRGRPNAANSTTAPHCRNGASTAWQNTPLLTPSSGVPRLAASAVAAAASAIVASISASCPSQPAWQPPKANPAMDAAMSAKARSFMPGNVWHQTAIGMPTRWTIGTVQGKQRPVLIVDEAHHLRNDVLEELRLLTNYEMDSENRLCLLLVGLTELRRRLQMAVHESLEQRIVIRYHLGGLGRDELPSLNSRCAGAGLQAVPAPI